MTDFRGRTILITRTPDEARPWADAFESLGARCVIFPCVRTISIDTDETRGALARAVADAGWMAFTSRRGVQAAADLLTEALPAHMRIAAVGPRTAAEARERFARCDLVSDGTGRALGEALADAVAGDRRWHVVLPIADRGRPDVENVLRPLGIHVDRIAVYRTEPAPEEVPPQDLSALGIDTVLLASPSAVTGLLHRATVSSDIRIVTIGPTTTEAARAAGLAVSGEAARPNFEALVNAIP